jgi:hypothetical protein
LAELPWLAHYHAGAWLAQCLAIPKAAQLRTGYLDMNHRKKETAPGFRMRGTGAIVCLGTLFITSHSGISQATQATPLPLSGRAGQSGSVTAVETPIAGTTTSVDTINPTVQVQGPYTGGASSSAKPSRGDSTITLARWARATLCVKLKGRVRLREAPCFPM